ncbi:amino acid ABC transporter permease [Pandoraea norimbergensis]|uniref:Amino acid ABC transporter permease n=1 Tax=Pandoraea norimbergensis TaxID=93219 RepID=A0ABN4JKD1_9BURK|nr:amino acid ABC transporter permease [Pandoraea norimbergensis]ALS61384.1 amino acid ABC transporter permease [Pandoraea norimbergensis]
MKSVDWTLRDVRHARARFPWAKALSWLIAIAVAAKVLWAVLQNPNFQWEVVRHYLNETSILHGLETTLSLTVVSMVLGSIIGLVLAIARISDNALARSISSLYIWFFRGTPLLVQLIFWYNMSTLFPKVGYTLPWESVGHSWNTNDLITPLTAAIAGLALNEAAYMAEIIRAGLSSVDPKQMETAQAFGMSRLRALRRIVIPQAMRSIIPPAGNQLISMIKATSLVSVIAMSDLLYSAQTIYNRTFEVVPLLIVAVLWYLLITSVLNLGQRVLEQRFSRGFGDMGAKAKVGVVSKVARRKPVPFTADAIEAQGENR